MEVESRGSLARGTGRHIGQGPSGDTQGPGGPALPTLLTANLSEHSPFARHCSRGLSSADSLELHSIL